ncbi:VOC family protein [Flavobacterium cellulosilyticum]|uniref:VOC family protein n=1 Tax=Flavobacterium cellulosilyticum TaxID=2541731 RepID=A0A4V2Z062_9FLAO|nr:VOC family protein [Flavobacterium cellulosilyticum]TDD99267.1 VOC family protein [Flavobacterium cellulosilyticum]
MAIINPYINFNGNSEEAFTFYKSVFGGEFAMIVRFKDMPNPEAPLSDKEANKIMHIALPIGKENVLMATDFLESQGHKMIEGNRYSLSINAQSRDEADQIFNGLTVGGKIEVPIAESPWGSYFGLFQDKFGIQWMVDFDPNYNKEV